MQQPAWGQQQPVQQTQAPVPAWGQHRQQPWAAMTTTNKEVPAVVVPGTEEKKDLRDILRTISPVAESAVTSIHKATSGPPRVTLHCQQSAVQLVQSLVPLLLQRSIPANFANAQVRPAPKARQAAVGVTTAARKAGICRFYTNQEPCSFNDKSGRCNFTCWCGPPAGP